METASDGLGGLTTSVAVCRRKYPVCVPVSPEEAERINVARSEARALGYTLFVEEALNVEPLTHMAFAAPYLGTTQASMGRFLSYSTSAAEAAEAGADILRGIVERGDAWPESG